MKTIFITGASSGIGKSTAKLFSQKGFQVIASMRSPEKEDELHKLENVLVVKLDVEKREEMEEAIHQGIEKFGTIDTLINNAGYCAFGPLELATDEQIRKQYNVNVFGVMNMIQAILPHFRQKNDGSIINISSIGGKVANPYLSLYQSSKFAIEGLSESLYYELAPYHIKVKLIEPGNIETDFTGRSLQVLQRDDIKDYDDHIQKFLDMLMADRKKGNISSPELVAEVILKAVEDKSDQFRYLAGEDAEFLNHKRKELTDEAFLQFMKGVFPLS
jgi:NAD(P)-dependent dehydrogenase (short-subunit alcohol dehydrogenase family)